MAIQTTTGGQVLNNTQTQAAIASSTTNRTQNAQLMNTRRVDRMANSTDTIGGQVQNTVNRLDGNTQNNQNNTAEPVTRNAQNNRQDQQAQNTSTQQAEQQQVQAAEPQTRAATNQQRVVDPYGLNLSSTQNTLLRDLYVSDSRGNIPEGYTFSVRDWYYGTDNKLGVGDVLLIRNEADNIVDYRVLSASDIYDINYRENLINNVTEVGRKWSFTPNLVELPNDRLQNPVDRYYWAGSGWGVEKLVAQNDHWDLVERNGSRVMLQRQFDDHGNRVKASDAIQDVFNNPQDYAFDCATPMPLLNMKTTLDVIGEDDFNRNAGQLAFSSWYDQYDASYFDGGYNINYVNTVGAGDIVVNNRETLDGEMDLFNPDNGDKLILGGVYYFEKPGDNTTAVQGWNTVYLGENADGSHRFWATALGNVDVDFRDGSYITEDSTSGAFKDHYLGSAQINSNINRLYNWDSDRSGMWNY